MAVFAFTAEGDLKWAHRIPKKQKYSYKVTSVGNIALGGGFARIHEYFSYVSAVTSDKLYIMFNDNPKNTTSDDKEKAIRDLTKTVVNLYTIDLDSGKKEDKLFFNGKAEDVYLNTSTSYQQNSKTKLIIFARKGAKYKYGIFIK